MTIINTDTTVTCWLLDLQQHPLIILPVVNDYGGQRSVCFSMFFWKQSADIYSHFLQPLAQSCEIKQSGTKYLLNACDVYHRGSSLCQLTSSIVRGSHNAALTSFANYSCNQATAHHWAKAQWEGFILLSQSRSPEDRKYFITNWDSL